MKRKQISLRLEEDILERASILTDVMREHKNFKGSGVSQASVYRMALYRGLSALEEQYEVEYEYEESADY